MSLLDDYFQLKNQWKATKLDQNIEQFQHLHSKQKIEQHLLTGVHIKQLDMFTSRENYSLPFCPKIYKCSIVNNYCMGNNLIFDLAIICEKMQGRFQEGLKPQVKKAAIKKLEKQIEHLVQAFYYLCKRYGPFIVHPSLIAWNQYQIVKVWQNQNFLSSNIQFPTQNEQQMVKSLIRVMEDLFEINFTSKRITTFTLLLETLEKSQFQKSGDCSKRVKFDKIEEDRCSKGGESKEVRAFPTQRKNITFLFNNESINSKGLSLKSPKFPQQQERPTSFQFDKRSKRCKSSGQQIKKRREGPWQENFPEIHKEKSFTHNLEQMIQKTRSQNNLIKQEFEKSNEQWIHNKGERQDEKENLDFHNRKETKNLTCNLGDGQHLVHHHTRRYSSNCLQQQTNLIDTVSKSQANFHSKRKSSLLRFQLQQHLDCLFLSDGEISFDSYELQKELDGVL